MASIGWELTRMDPDTGYLVEPWSLRGYETVHGSVIFTIGALIVIAGLATIWERSKEPLLSSSIAALMGLAVIVVTALYAKPVTNDAGEVIHSVDITISGGVPGALLTIVGAYVFYAATTRYVAPLLSRVMSGFVAKAVASVGTFAIAAVILYLLAFGTSLTANPAVWIAIVMVLLVGLAITARPVQLAANRMLIFSITVGGTAIALSAAAIREHLVGAQLELTGITGQYKDTQITSGYFIALAGILLAFIGAVSLWAKRRDIIINEQRAEKQRAAAEASAAEIRQALDRAQQHQQEVRRAQQQTAGGGSTPPAGQPTG
jgi:hypothetical protein